MPNDLPAYENHQAERSLPVFISHKDTTLQVIIEPLFGIFIPAKMERIPPCCVS
ncbi:hypothetical protein [Chloroherpeton thalassium]|uniref:hypothetical protein n=1 Tax=Chloroherpeton thalassium TaxID=100716 RepID=UPI0002FA3272|nr:hypothetical protein [Chloroherpeton thalassium]